MHRIRAVIKVSSEKARTWRLWKSSKQVNFLIGILSYIGSYIECYICISLESLNTIQLLYVIWYIICLCFETSKQFSKIILILIPGSRAGHVCRYVYWYYRTLNILGFSFLQTKLPSKNFWVVQTVRWPFRNPICKMNNLGKNK